MANSAASCRPAGPRSAWRSANSWASRANFGELPAADSVFHSSICWSSDCRAARAIRSRGEANASTRMGMPMSPLLATRPNSDPALCSGTASNWPFQWAMVNGAQQWPSPSIKAITPATNSARMSNRSNAFMAAVSQGCGIVGNWAKSHKVSVAVE